MTEILTAKPEDLPEILKLMKLVQPHLKRTPELLYWQYFASQGAASKIYVLKDCDTKQLISTYCTVSQYLKIDDKKVLGWMIQDVLTHPEHRGKGYLHLLAEKCLKEMKSRSLVGYTFPNEISQKSFLRSGWARACLVPNREAELTTVSGADVHGFQAVDFRAGEKIWNASGLKFGVDRSAEFLKWRYSKPGEKYHCFSESDRFFVALKFFDSPHGRILHVLDLFISKNESAEELLKRCAIFAMKQGAFRMTGWLPEGHPYAEAFDRFGLLLKTRPERFFYVHVPAAEAELGRNWHLTQADSDVY